MRVADYIAQFLVENGITDCFSVVGGGAMHLNDAFARNEILKVTYNHHEQASAIAAEGYARYSGKPAAVCVTSGPGGTNAITGVMGAWVDSIPMIVVSGQVKLCTTISSTEVPLRQLGDQEFNIVDSVSCMTKYAVMIDDPNDIAYCLEKALFLSTSGRPGPVWLDIPVDIQGANIEPAGVKHYFPSDDGSVKPQLIEEDILLLLKKLENAERPVILAGGGIRTGHAYREFLQVVEKLQVPVVTAWNAHDLLADEHPLYCGRPGTLGTRGGNFVIQNADMVISLACRMNIRQISYNWECFAKDAYLAAIDIDENELRKPTLQIDLPIHADILDSLASLLRNDYNAPNRNHWNKWCKEVNRKYPIGEHESNGSGAGIDPYVFMRQLSNALPENSATVASNGSACVCSFQAYTIKSGQRLFTNSGCAAMGYGLPSSIGVAIAREGKQVICLEGDGSIMMNLQELQTIKSNELNVLVFILNNDGYHSIRQTQTNNFESMFCGIGKDSGDLSFPDWKRIASGFDIPFYSILDEEHLHETLNIVLGKNGPIICEVLLDKKRFFEPKVASRKMPDGSMVSSSLEDMYPFLSEAEILETALFARR